jgi:transposase
MRGRIIQGDSSMTIRRRLFKKITEHLSAAGVPRYIQRCGPHKFRTAELVLGLAVREAYRLSYRRAAAFLDEYYNLQLHWTTLQKAAARLPAVFWHQVLCATAQIASMLAAIDATGYTRSCPSEHYLRRIDGVRPQVPVKLSILVDVETRKILSARVRVKPAHDVRDVHGLIQRAAEKPFVLVMDKGYDSEPLHEWLDEWGVWSIAPTRRGCRRGRHRTRLRDHFPSEEYAQRNIVESVFKRLKALFGGHVRGRSARTVRAELFTRLILHNISWILKRFSTEPCSPIAL